MMGRRRLLLVLCLLLGHGVSADGVIATVGAEVTLPCKYDANYYGKLPACWGRGAIPSRGCSDEVIKSDGSTMSSRLSERYLLMGDLSQGDVSLTIRQLEEGDSGTYGCRVEIPGWFNDHKHQVTLTVLAVRPNPLKVETREVKERSVTVRWAPAFDGGRPITSYRLLLKNKQASWDSALTTDVTNPDLTQLTVMDLRPAKTYNLCIYASNSVGMSEISNVLTVTTKEAAPDGPPLDVELVGVSPHNIKVTWKPPRPELRNGVLRGYTISYREYEAESRHFRRWQHLSVQATRETESVILSGLKPSTKYGVMIQARTNAGVGPASTAPLCSTQDEDQITTTASTTKSASTTATESILETTSSSTAVFLAAPPDPPVVELKEVRDNVISLSWTPGFDGDSPITGYYLECKDVHVSWDNIKSAVDFSPDLTDATLLESTPSTYNIRMFAKNSFGTSRASNILTVTIAGQQTAGTDTHAAASVESQSDGHLVAIVVPVVLVLLIVAVITTWQVRRIKQKKGSLNMWLSNGALRYRGSESLQEL